jgi:intraflagellar transport protein 88
MAAHNLCICYYASGDREKMKKGFTYLLNVKELIELEIEEEEEFEKSNEKAKNANESILTAMKGEEEWKHDRRERRRYFHRHVLTVARLFALQIETTIPAGFDWCIAQLRMARSLSGSSTDADESLHDISTLSTQPSHLSQGYPSLASSLLLSKGLYYLTDRNIPAAISIFRSFSTPHESSRNADRPPLERNDSHLSASFVMDDSENADEPRLSEYDQQLLDAAATNLSFLYFLEDDLKHAGKYAEIAMKKDRYNAKALTNKANLYFAHGQYEAAKELYLEAIGVEADCVEAIYNLGLVNKRLGLYHDALQAFKKLHRVVPSDLCVLYQIAMVYSTIDEIPSAVHWLTTLHTACPSDPTILAKLGQLYAAQGDDTNAYHAFSDAYDLFGCQIEIISWLGIYFVKNELYDRALPYFLRAAQCEPNVHKWKLMCALCYRRMNQWEKAFQLYQYIHQIDSENIECLRYLVSMSKERESKQYAEWKECLDRAEEALIAAKRNEEADDDEEVNHPGYDRQSSHLSNSKSYLHFEEHKTGSTAPKTSPMSSPRIMPTFDASLPPQQTTNTINTGKGVTDEWGDEGLGDDLLPL